MSVVINVKADLINADVQIVAEKADKAVFSAEEVIGDRPVYDLKAIYKGGTISDFNGGKVAVEIPYTLQNDETAENVVAVYIDGNGKASVAKGSKYDVEKEVVIFTTTHFSVYGVGYTAETPETTELPFIDITGHWVKKSIAYVYENSLMSGTIEVTFTPNGTIPETNNAVTLADDAKIGEWAAAAVKNMQMAGTLSRRDGNVFDPQEQQPVPKLRQRFIAL